MNRVIQYAREVLRVSKSSYESGEVVESIVTGLIGLALAIAAVWGFTTSSEYAHIGKWAGGVGFVLLFIFVAPFRLWLLERKKIERYEEEARPKLRATDFFHIAPKGATGDAVVAKELRLRIYNNSSTVIRNCHVRMHSFVNVNGHESDFLGIRFKLSTDQPHHIQGYEHAQAFDLPPHTQEDISICGTNKNVPGDTVIMLYAARGKGSEGVANSIPFSFFPHILTLHIAADNLVRPVECKYRLFVDDTGVFQASGPHGLVGTP